MRKKDEGSRVHILPLLSASSSSSSSLVFSLFHEGKERTKDPLESETKNIRTFRLLSSGHQRSYSLMGPGSLLTAEEKSIIGG